VDMVNISRKEVLGSADLRQTTEDSFTYFFENKKMPQSGH